MSAILLVVGDDAAPTTGDAAIKTHLEGLGHTVTYAADEDGDLSASYDLVFCSDSCSSTTLAATYRATTKPVIQFETGNLTTTGMGISSTTAVTGTGTTTTYDINGSHALASGLTDPLTVFSAAQTRRYVQVASLCSGASVLSYMDNATTQWTAVTVDTGATLLNGPVAQGKRGVVTATDAQVASSIAAGFWELVDKIVVWMLPSATTVTATTATVSGSANDATASGVGVTTAATAALTAVADNASVSSGSAATAAADTAAMVVAALFDSTASVSLTLTSDSPIDMQLTAYDPSISLATAATANATAASVTAQADNAGVAGTATADTAATTLAADTAAATGAGTAQAGTAGIAVSAADPTSAGTATATTAAWVVLAADSSVSTTAGSTATPGSAGGVFAALDALISTSTTTSAEVALVTFVAPDASGSTGGRGRTSAATGRGRYTAAAAGRAPSTSGG